MARARNIKPSLFKNELLGEEDPIVTLLFIGLWSLADREGRLEYRPKRIKAELFPYRENLDINRYLTVLSRLGFTRVYAVDNLEYLEVINFTKHQRPHHTEKASVIPPPPEKCNENKELNDNGELTVKPPLSNGQYPPDSLIPDTLYSLSKGADEQDLTSNKNDENEIKKDLYQKSESKEPPHKVYSNGLEQFPMFSDWRPDGAELQMACVRYAVKLDDITRDTILNFIDYWSERTEVRTQAGWCKRLVSDFKQHNARRQSNAKRPQPRNTRGSKHSEVHDILESCGLEQVPGQVYTFEREVNPAQSNDS